MNKLNLTTSAKKGATSATVATGGVGTAYAIVVIARHFFKHEFTIDEALLLAGVLTAGIAGVGRAIENAVKWYIQLKK